MSLSPTASNRNFVARVLGVVVLALAGSHDLIAQQAAADRARASEAVLPLEMTDRSLTPDASQSLPSSPRLPGDAEYGEQVVLARRANHEPWSLAFDAEYFFTDNVALASAGELQDFYLRTGAQARYTNRISGDWFANAALDAHSILHDRYDALDFLLLKAEAGAMYRVPWLADTFLSAGYVGYWITEDDLTTESFQNHAISIGAQKVWKPARAMQIIAGATAEYSFDAEPAPPQRHEYSAYLGYRLRLNDNLSLSASYRLGFYDYPVIDRQDWNHVVVIGASYDITSWARVSLSASSAWNRSSVEFFDYDNIVSGISLSLHMEF